MDVRTVGRTVGRSDGRSVGRSVGRSYDDVITKISRMDGLPYFLSNGAPRARAFGARGAPLSTLQLQLRMVQHKGWWMETDSNYEYEAPKWFDFTADFESEINDNTR